MRKKKRIDELEHRTQVAKKACDLIAQGKDAEAVVLINELNDLKENETDYSNFEEAQEAIYKELPTVVEKVFHAAFMNCTKGFQITDDSDWKLVKPFIDEMERVFWISIEQQKGLLWKIWGCNDQMCKAGGTRKERQNDK